MTEKKNEAVANVYVRPESRESYRAIAKRAKKERRSISFYFCEALDLYVASTTATERK